MDVDQPENNYYYLKQSCEVSIALVDEAKFVQKGFILPLNRFEKQVTSMMDKITTTVDELMIKSIVIRTHGFYCAGIGMEKAFDIHASISEIGENQIRICDLTTLLHNIVINGRPLPIDNCSPNQFKSIVEYGKADCQYLMQPILDVVPIVNRASYKREDDSFYIKVETESDSAIADVNHLLEPALEVMVKSCIDKEEVVSACSSQLLSEVINYLERKYQINHGAATLVEILDLNNSTNLWMSFKHPDANVDGMSTDWVILYGRVSNLPFHAICLKWFNITNQRNYASIPERELFGYLDRTSNELAQLACAFNSIVESASWTGEGLVCLYCSLTRVHSSLFCPFLVNRKARDEYLRSLNRCTGCHSQKCQLTRKAKHEIHCEMCNSVYHATDSCDNDDVFKNIVVPSTQRVINVLVATSNWDVVAFSNVAGEFHTRNEDKELGTAK